MDALVQDAASSWSRSRISTLEAPFSLAANAAAKPAGPPPTINLLDISYIKAMANHVGCDLLEYKKNSLILQLRPDAPIDPMKLTAFMNEHKGDAHFVSDAKKAKLTLRVEDAPKDQLLLARIKEALKEIEGLRREAEESAS